MVGLPSALPVAGPNFPPGCLASGAAGREALLGLAWSSLTPIQAGWSRSPVAACLHQMPSALLWDQSQAPSIGRLLPCG
jgi:hypothetical protein